MAKVTKWPPQSDENTASGFLAIWALMNGCVVRLAELRPLLVHDLHARLDLLDVLDEGLGHVLAVGVVGAMVAILVTGHLATISAALRPSMVVFAATRKT